MNSTVELEHFLSFMKCQFLPSASVRSDESGFVRCITVSRQSGCGACFFAEKLAADLQARFPQDPRPWTVFDRRLVEVILRDHELPARLAAFMPEDRVGQLKDIIENLFGLHPPAEALVRRSSETILHLAQLGNAIIVGRGGNVITAQLPGMLHVRLVGSPEGRFAHLQQFDHLEKEQALKRMRREDGGRRRYLKKYFGKNIDDPLLYHFVMNTDCLALEDAVKTIGMLAQNLSIQSRASNAKGPLLLAAT